MQESKLLTVEATRRALCDNHIEFRMARGAQQIDRLVDRVHYRTNELLGLAKALQPFTHQSVLIDKKELGLQFLAHDRSPVHRWTFRLSTSNALAITL
jgi:hypothetical protein